MRALGKKALAGAVASAAVIVTPALADGTLAQVKARGHLVCGVSPGVAGFSLPDSAGEWRGLDVDFCRAVAAAIFDDPKAVRFVPLSSAARFTAVQSGEVDVLARNTTWTLSRDTSAMNFPAITFFDGQGFLVRKARGIGAVKDLDRATVCLQQGTTTELNLADWFRTRGLTYRVVTFANSEQTLGAYESGRCDAYSTDKSSLYGERLRTADPEEHVILDETISKEPFAPAVRQGDDQWRDIVAWTHYAMLDAEEAGIGQANLEAMRKSAPGPDARRILGLEGRYGERLGLTVDWAERIVRHVGNYGEVFSRNVGEGSPLKVPRGLNALWTQGGLHYGPPIR
ncbi:amino acid ABC transporter substrate-bindnig protein [Methylobacterium sp. Leaf399]|uniref:amino acid ABC transporter substrate-binding protein n=1 Tax=unclassified Methylobacterium TaxID=2615210 RepID=UPI0006FF3EE0|nr:MULTISPECIES: amino acid ABC transporter substrate-binding protein [unclassified Methylobacterium]KQP48996.1 amino acid ABC transporter substrate-bindnig protein [Methylobacterium sp. Leaf108]KQT18871.1 amino acid ABC transporter substrate-bindnig protein [Methylobacterium sp. Leaf399]